jgi:hypothetical protein
LGLRDASLPQVVAILLGLSCVSESGVKGNVVVLHFDFLIITL